MQTSKVVTMLASVAALSGAAHAGEVMAPPVAPSAGAEFLAKGKDTVSVRFAGRTEFEYSTAGSDDGFSFRRLRLGAKAKLGSGFTSELITDFAQDAGRRGKSADTKIRKAIVSYKFSDIFAIKAGRDKVVFGYEETSSSSSGVFLERSFINNKLIKDLDYGVQNGVTVSSDWGSGFSSALSIVDGTGGYDGTQQREGLDYYARVQWSNDSFTVGADYGDSGVNEGFTAYANYSIDGFNVLGEYFDVDHGPASSSDGFTVRASYRFDNFEPVVRYSDFSEKGDDGDEIYVGVNYYAAPGVTLLTGYSKVDQDVAGEDESFTARLRVLW